MEAFRDSVGKVTPHAGLGATLKALNPAASWEVLVMGLEALHEEPNRGRGDLPEASEARSRCWRVEA